MIPFIATGKSNMVKTITFLLCSVWALTTAFAQINLIRTFQPNDIPNFGLGVGISGNDMVVSDGLNLFFYEKKNENWDFLQKATPGQIAYRKDDMKNGQVAIDGNLVVFGAKHEDVKDKNGKTFAHAGAAYVFQKKDGKWVMTTRLTSPEPCRNGYFGSVDLWDQSILIGALGERPQSDVNPTNQYGAAYLFVLEEGKDQWSVLRKFENETPFAGGRYGENVNVNEDHIAVIGNSKKITSKADFYGTAYTDTSIIEQVDIYEIFHFRWKTRKIANKRKEGGWYNQTDSEDRHLVVSGFQDTSNTIDFFYFKNGNWTYLQTEKIGKEDYGDAVVKVDGNIAVLSASGSAKVRVYRFDPYREQWTLLDEITGEKGTHFGNSMAIDGNTLVIGAYWSGKCYVSLYEIKSNL